MQRALMTIAAALLLCGAGYLLLDFFIDSGVRAEKLALFTAAVTLLLATLAAAFSLRALLKTTALHADMTRLARSVDMAVTALSAGKDREASAVDALRQHVQREIARLEAMPSRVARDAPMVEPTNVVMLPARRRFRPEIVSSQPLPFVAAANAADIVVAAEEAMRGGPASLSFHRLISVSRADTMSHDVLARIAVPGLPFEDLDRLPAAASPEVQAAFCRWLLAGAIDEARNNLSGEAGALSLNVAVPEALLAHGRELVAAVESLQAAPDTASRIVLVMPSALLEAVSEHDEAIALFARTGARLAADGWRGGRESFEALRARGIIALRVSADLLAGRCEAASLVESPVRMIEMAAASDLPLIATGVGTEDDTIAMMDFGVAQMTGPRFVRPRRLRPRLRRDATGG